MRLWGRKNEFILEFDIHRYLRGVDQKSGFLPAMVTERFVYLNGEIMPEKAASISVLDHSFMYGNGVFETMRAYGDKVLFLDEHMDRLFRSLEALEIPVERDRDFFKSAIKQTVKKNGFLNTYIRITISRGVGEPGLDPELCGEPTVVVFAKLLNEYPPEWYKKGVGVLLLPFTNSLSGALKVPVKSCNYLGNFFARNEARKHGALEGIMLSSDNGVTEGSVSNIFIIKDRKIITSPPGPLVLDGVTRGKVIEAAKRGGYIVLENRFSGEELYAADECFLTNTTLDIMPVTRIGEEPVGNGRPGVVTTKLLKLFRDLVSAELNASQP